MTQGKKGNENPALRFDMMCLVTASVLFIIAAILLPSDPTKEPLSDILSIVLTGSGCVIALLGILLNVLQIKAHRRL